MKKQRKNDYGIQYDTIKDKYGGTLVNLYKELEMYDDFEQITE